MSARAPIDVVVCSYGGDDPDLTLQTLERVARQEAPDQLLLIDMSPTERIAQPAAAIPGVTVHRAPSSSGLGESRQIGLDLASSRYVAFLDSDALPRAGWLDALAGVITQDRVAIAGGPVLPLWPSKPPRLFRSQAAEAFLSMFDLGPAPLDVPRVMPGNMVIDRTVLPTLFRTDLGRTGGQLLGAEEVQMMIDAAASGARIVYTPGAAVDHHSRTERLNWRWMWRRAHAAGREAGLHGARLEPIPRAYGLRDYAFLAAISIPYFSGQAHERRARRK